MQAGLNGVCGSQSRPLYGQLFCDREQSLPHVATSPNMMSSTRNGLKTDFDDNFRIIVLDETSEFRMRNLVA